MVSFKKTSEYETIVSYHGTYHLLDRYKPCWCEHNNQAFLAWHTAYLMRFEEALANHLADKTLGIPYWDWTDLDWNWQEFLEHEAWATGLRQWHADVFCVEFQ